MKRQLFNADHERFREQFGRFLDREVAPHYLDWERAGQVPREVWRRAGASGYLCPWLPEEYGGSGADFLYSVVQIEEMARRMLTGFTLFVHNDIICPYLWNFGDEAQKRRWLPGCASGEIVTAIAMTEPDCGSDLQAIRATAVRDGASYVLNGRKTFITNGITNDLVIVAAKTDPSATPTHRGISLLLVPAGTPGYIKGRRLEKIGWHAQDTAELIFEDCRVPAENLLGGEGQGFKILMRELQQERLTIVISCMATIHAVLGMTADYIKQRRAFGRPIAAFQNTRFKMAEMFTVAEITQAFIDRLIAEHVAGANVNTETAMAKAWTAERLKDITDACLQFFGGYGYMEEYPIARAYRDSRVQTIYAGATEIMHEIVSRAVLG
jgi:acyl-CoA dehydrogenase